MSGGVKKRKKKLSEKEVRISGQLISGSFIGPQFINANMGTQWQSLSFRYVGASEKASVRCKFQK